MIEPLHIEGTTSTPEVYLSKEEDIFIIKGEILPENSFDFFSPIQQWFKKYSEVPNESTVLELSFSIINTSSIRRFVSILNILEEIAKAGKFVKIIFILLPDDETMEYLVYEFSNVYKTIKIETQFR